jgi:hypothetical protein
MWSIHSSLIIAFDSFVVSCPLVRNKISSLIAHFRERMPLLFFPQ